MRFAMTPDDVRRLALRATMVPEVQGRTEVRIAYSIITFGFIYFLLLKPVYYMWAVKGSAIWKAATAATLPNWAIAIVFTLCIIVTVPHLFSLLCRPDWLHCKLPRKLAGAAAGASGFMWLYLAANVLATRSPGLVWLYLGNFVACVIVGMAYGFSVNSQQLRERIEK